MIYFDNSATTFPKPAAVQQAAASAMRLAANPGRGGYDMALRASEEVYRARKTAADFFKAPNEAGVIFTLNCTVAVNLVLKGVLKDGDHVVVSDLEHNAVMRPLNGLRSQGVTYSVARTVPMDNDATVDAFRRAINGKTRLIMCTHASNVWGLRLPVERLAALAHEYGLLMAVDAAQSAGVVPIDLEDSRIDFLCAAGHKGLYGPMGTGMLIVNSDTLPRPLIEGGTGSSSFLLQQPEELPERLESGTPNLAGLAGLRAGLTFVSQSQPEKIARHEFALMRRLYTDLSQIEGVRLYLPEPAPPYFVPLLSFNFENADSETAARLLGRQGIAVRAGLHCCPAAHQKMGTIDTGAVRVSPSYFSRPQDVSQLLSVVRQTAASLRRSGGTG